jgi:hypothetical protein
MVAWFHKNVNLNDKIWIQLKHSPFFLWISCDPYLFHKNGLIKQSPQTEPHKGGRHTYDGVLPGDQKGTTLLSPPQCHTAFGTTPHTLDSVDQNPVCRPRTLPLSTTGTPRLGFRSGWSTKCSVWCIRPPFSHSERFGWQSFLCVSPLPFLLSWRISLSCYVCLLTLFII